MKTVAYAFGLGAALLFTQAAQAQVVTIATNQQGTLAYNAGVNIAKVVTNETDLTARIQPMAGSSTYTPMINRGEVTFGFSNAQEFLWAYTGTGTFEGKKNENLRYVGMIFPLRAGPAVVADTGMTKVSDLQNYKGKRITSEYTSLKTIARYLEATLANAGLSYDDFQKVPVSGFVQGISAIGEGKTDITWISLGAAAGRKSMAELKGRGGWRYLSFDTSPEAVKRFTDLMPASKFVEISNTKMPGIVEPTYLVQLNFMMTTNKDTPEDVVYKVTKAIAQNQQELAKAFPPFRGLKIEQMAQDPFLPYHPGAIKAYKELGIPVAEQAESTK